MSYQVFAIRTRPQSFDQVIGQEPVTAALSHALNKNLLHHAYLFTGTRGVGKTTIARLVAKSLNCEKGVSSTPCNSCNNCQSIMEGRFPDLIEIDAASKTKVEDTRALLDTVIYAPTQGKYKVYLIDEVHMLSTHSFNALLKTLEEPPSHVKFLLATTDPQKIPATIVSRCLQFTLKWVDASVIAQHLANILDKDNTKYEKLALEIISQAAEGSIRDALSLLEQAVALGAGEVNTEQVRLMLGKVAGADIIELLHNICAHDGNKLVSQINKMAVSGADFSQILTQLIYALHQMAIVQQAPDIAIELDAEISTELRAVATKITPEDLQIYYQIALLAKRDLPYSPQPRLALEMALLRMMSFGVRQGDASNKAIPHIDSMSSRSSADPLVKPEDAERRSILKEASSSAVMTESVSQSSEHINISFTKETWGDILSKLNLKGMHLQLLKNSEFVSFADKKLVVNVDPRLGVLVNPKRLQEIEQNIQHVFNQDIKLIVNKVDKHHDVSNTPAKIEQSTKQEKHDSLVVKLQNDPHVKEIIETFSGELKLDSVEVTED